MKRVYLQFYNRENLGDDLFVKIITERYENSFSTVSTSKSYFLDTAAANLKVQRSRVVAPLLRLASLITHRRGLLQLHAANASDLFVYIGGSIFIESGNIQKWVDEKRFYQKLKVPYYILGSNIGPYKDSSFPALVTDIAAGAIDICLRDKASYNMVSQLSSARLSTDIAFTLDDALYDTNNAQKTAIISVIDGFRKFSQETTLKYESEINNLTLGLVNGGYKVIYMAFCKYEGDEEASARILTSLPAGIREEVSTFNYRGDLEDALSIIASSDIIIGSRFHANILGLVFGKRVLPMAYSDKTIDILNDMGFPGDIIDIRGIDKFDASLIDFEKIPVVDIREQKALAQRQFQELDKVLKKGSK